MSTDVESFVYNDRKDEVLMARLVSYCSVLLTLLAFTFTCIGLANTTQTAIEKKLYLFSFPYFDQVPAIQPGTVISLDWRGYAFTGAGTTVSRNVTQTTITEEFVENIVTEHWGYEVIFSASVGKLHAFEISYDDISILNQSIDLPLVFGAKMVPSGMHRLGNHTLLIIGSGAYIPVTINVEVISKTLIKVEMDAGDVQLFSSFQEQSYPHSDDLGDGVSIAITYEEDSNLLTTVLRWDNTTSGKTSLIKKLPSVTYSEKYQFHNLAGMDSTHYVVASAGGKSGSTDSGPIKLAVATISGDVISVSEWTSLSLANTFGFFSIDNFDREGFVLCYNVYHSDGISCIDVLLSPSGAFTAASSVSFVSGGAATYYARLKLTILGQRTFSLLYQNSERGGLLTLALGGFNDAGDLIKIGPSYIVSQRNMQDNVVSSYSSSAKVDDFKIAITEVVKYQSGKCNAILHTAYIYPRPVGIASRTFTGKTEVVFGGVYQAKNQKFEIGRAYYTNDRGMLLRGPSYYGYENRNHGFFYVANAQDQSLMSLNNRVGVAVASDKLMLSFN